MSALYNDLPLVEGTYVLMQDVDRFNNVDYDTFREAEINMQHAQLDGEDDMWIGFVEDLGGSHLEILFVCN